MTGTTTRAAKTNKQHNTNDFNQIIILVKHCKFLFKAKQYKSCEIVAQLALSKLGTLNNNNGAKKNNLSIQLLEIMGDCAQQQQQSRRAISFFRRAHSASSSTFNQFFDNNNEATSKSRQQEQKRRNGLIWKEAQCLIQLGSVLEAISVLERVQQRDLGMEMTLGRLYASSGRFAEAISSFLTALKMNPYALEATEWLAVLYANRSRVMAAIEQACHNINNNNNQAADEAKVNEDGLEFDSDFVMDIVGAQFLMHQKQTSAALNAFGNLEREFPNNVFLLQRIALLQMELQNEVGAEKTFGRARQLDECNMDYVGEYAQVLQKRGAFHELNRLAYEMLDIDDKRAEAWVALALFHQIRADHDRALATVDKAISLDQQYSFAHRLKGTILLAEKNQPERAAASFFHANEIVRHVANYEGLVECYLAREQYKEAICMAREAIEVAPRDARAVTLVGLALSQARPTEGRDRAKRAFRKALGLDPTALKPLLSLVDIHLQERDFAACIQLLQQGKEGNKCRDVLETRLGEVYTMNESFMEAMSAFHTALSINPDCADAKRGMERLEKVMRGIDPDDEIADNAEEASSPPYRGSYAQEY